MKKLIASLVSLCFVFIMALPARASTFEWIDSASVPGTWYSGVADTITWSVRTSGAYTENQSIFYAEAASSTPSMYGSWVEVTGCRRSNLVNTFVVNSCNFSIVPSLGIGTHLKFRVTTNYSGCGGYTVNPGASCGDFFETESIIY